MTKVSGTSEMSFARWLRAALVVAVAAGVAAPAMAGDEPGPLTRALGLRTTVPAAPDFIVQTRTPNQDFIPVHTPRAKPTGQPMPKAKVAATEKALDSARIRQDRLVGRPSAPPGKSVADAMDAPVKKAKRKPRTACGLTCPSPVQVQSQSGKEAQ